MSGPPGGGEALLAKVLAGPDDLGARRAYAAAIGGDRGAFIEASVDLLERVTPDRREAARHASTRLLGAHRAAWEALASGWAEVRWRGGFIEAIQTTGERLLERGAALVAAEPVRSVKLTSVTDAELGALASSPILVRVEKLVIGAGYSDAGFAALASGKSLGALRSLSAFGLGSDAMESLARAKGTLTGLGALSLAGCEIGDEGAAALAKWKGLTTIQRLYLPSNGLSDEGVAALVRSRHLGALRILGLGGNECGDEALKAIANTKSLKTLERLELDRTQASDEGAGEIALSKTLSSLKFLDLVATEVGSEGRSALSRRPGLKVSAGYC